jgi:GT2 family glycosyltransferase
MATVSIIIVNWNGQQHLQHCLPALLAQSQQADEIIVVDNASHDESVDFLKTFPQVTTLQLEENLGFTGGNIAGYKEATGDYIVLLNNDTKPEPTWLEQLVNCADNLPEVGIVASYLTDWEGQTIDCAGDGCTVTGRGFKHHLNEKTHMLASGYVFSACAGAALYKREMLEEIGFLDERFFMNAEDTDLAFRAQLRGWKVYFCAEAVVRHRIGASQGIYSPGSVYYSSRNHLWLYFKCLPKNLAIKYAASFLIHFILSLVFLARRKQLRPYIVGTRDAIKKLPSFLPDRKAIQNSRKISNRELEKQLELLHVVLLKRLNLYFYE